MTRVAYRFVPGLRIVAQWLISRSIDESKSVPRWVANWIEKDAALRQYHDQAKRLADRLRRGSSQVMTMDLTRSHAPLRSSNREMVVVGLGGRRSNMWSHVSIAMLAATILITVGISLRGKLGWSPKFEDREGQLEKTAPVLAVDQVEIQKAFTRGREWIALWNKRSQELIEPRVQENPIKLAYEFSTAEVAGAAKGVGTDCGKLLGKLDDYIEEDRVRWIEEGQGAWDFFAKKLPLSAGKLVGIK